MAVSQEKLNNLVNELSELTILEVSDLVKVLEDKWGVSASAPVAVAAVASSDTSSSAEAKTEFDVIIKGAQDGKSLPVIKELRNILTSLTIMEAKAIVAFGSTGGDASKLPAVVSEADGGVLILKGVSKDEADSAAKKLSDLGTNMEVK